MVSDKNRIIPKSAIDEANIATFRSRGMFVHPPFLEYRNVHIPTITSAGMVYCFFASGDANTRNRRINKIRRNGRGAADLFGNYFCRCFRRLQIAPTSNESNEYQQFTFAIILADSRSDFQSPETEKRKKQ